MAKSWLKYLWNYVELFTESIKKAFTISQRRTTRSLKSVRSIQHEFLRLWVQFIVWVWTGTCTVAFKVHNDSLQPAYVALLLVFLPYNDFRKHAFLVHTAVHLVFFLDGMKIKLARTENEPQLWPASDGFENLQYLFFLLNSNLFNARNREMHTTLFPTSVS